MPQKRPKVICPHCSNEFFLAPTLKKCGWCTESFEGRGDKRYCSLKCKQHAMKTRQWQRLKRDPEHLKKRRDYMREYMRTYRGPKNAS